MKLYFLSLVAISAASTSLAAEASLAEQEEFTHIGFFNRLVAPLQSASVQCQGDCQGNGDENTVASAGLQQPESTNVIAALIRDFMHPFQQTEAQPSVATKAAFDGEIPAIDMMYSNFNALSPYSPAVASPTPSVVNRWEAADELPEVAASETTVAAASGWLFAADNVQTASNAVDSSAYPLFDIATSSAVAAPQAYEDSESVQDFGLNINSWGQRIDSAAHRLASNVGGIIVQFIPSTAQAMSLFGNEDVPEAASTTAPAPFYWF